MIFFTADLHFGHENILTLSNRPFESVDEMNEVLIANWNRKVGKADTVYIIGDMMWKDAPCLDILSRLKGHKVLIVGNHDNVILNNSEILSSFDEVHKYIETSLDCHPVTMCHYPMLEWKNSRKTGSSRLGYLIYGHIHNRYDLPEYQILMSHPNALNAGVDINGYEPVTFDELYANNMAFKEAHLSSDLLNVLRERETSLVK